MNYLEYRWRLWRLQKERDRFSREFRTKYRDAKESGASEEQLAEVSAMESVNMALTEDDIKFLETRYRLDQAQRLLLPAPEFTTKDKGGVWCESEIKSRRYYLSPEGLAQLRSAIRQEKRERRESAGTWIGWSIGLIGALTGLVSMIKK